MEKTLNQKLEARIILAILAVMALAWMFMGCLAGSSKHKTSFKEAYYEDGLLTHTVEQDTEVTITKDGTDASKLSTTIVQDASGGYSIHAGQKQATDLDGAAQAAANASIIISVLQAMGLLVTAAP